MEREVELFGVKRHEMCARRTPDWEWLGGRGAYFCSRGECPKEDRKAFKLEKDSLGFFFKHGLE